MTDFSPRQSPGPDPAKAEQGRCANKPNHADPASWENSAARNPVVAWLTARGFGPVPLKVLLYTVLTAAFTLPAGLGPWACGRDIGWFGVFALFSAWNFFCLVYFVQGIISNSWTGSAGFKAFFALQFRLFLTAILVYGALVWWSVPVAVLVGGLSTSLIWLLLLGSRG